MTGRPLAAASIGDHRLEAATVAVVAPPSGADLRMEVTAALPPGADLRMEVTAALPPGADLRMEVTAALPSGADLRMEVTAALPLGANLRMEVTAALPSSASLRLTRSRGRSAGSRGRVGTGIEAGVGVGRRRRGFRRIRGQ